MFESLSEKLSGILDKLTGRGALSEEDVNAAMREVRRALLEADLPEQNFYVIRDEFKLQSRPHYTPPRGSAPPANPQGQPNPQQQPPGQVQPQALL